MYRFAALLAVLLAVCVLVGTPSISIAAETPLIKLHESPVPIPEIESNRGGSDDVKEPTDVRLYELIDIILQYSPLPQSPFVLYLSDEDDDQTPTANATGYLRLKTISAPSANDGIVSNIELERIIVFNRAYLDDLLSAETRDQRRKRWSLIALAAHEIGHFLARHHDTPIHSKAKERQADWISGYFVGRMGATRDEALEWLQDSEELGTSKYPSKAERLAAMEQGWTAGRRSPKPVDIAQIFTGKARNIDQAFDVFHGFDIREGDLCQVHGSMSIQSCAGSCEVETGCLAFSYDRRHGRCYLKSAIASTRHREGHSTIGIRKPNQVPASSTDPIKFWNFAKHKFVFETSSVSKDPYPLGRRQTVKGPDECKEACLADDYCNGYAVVAPQSAAADSGANSGLRCLGFRMPPLAEASEEPADHIAYKVQEGVSRPQPPECEPE